MKARCRELADAGDSYQAAAGIRRAHEPPYVEVDGCDCAEHRLSRGDESAYGGGQACNAVTHGHDLLDELGAQFTRQLDTEGYG